MDQNLSNVINSLMSHVAALPKFIGPDVIANLVNQINTLDTSVAAIIQTTPPPAPKADYTNFDKAVAAFRADGNVDQTGVDAVTHVLTVNTP